jgi:hypothetical protein
MENVSNISITLLPILSRISSFLDSKIRLVIDQTLDYLTPGQTLTNLTQPQLVSFLGSLLPMDLADTIHSSHESNFGETTKGQTPQPQDCSS